MAEEGMAAGAVMGVHTALQDMLNTSLIHSGLAHGISHLCVLASNSDEPMYVRWMDALCAEHQIKADDNKKLGGWVGLLVGCSCMVFKAKQAKDVIQGYFTCKK
ncbi:unnamed protein product [Nyctereutes procyonoides]|uniref:(raccoon dog) hypothetical protein n=1 Tax=Nyctereutes procyonoides TaxID=34880 RepID=A0A811Y816_NYCPR|nr:unnamed protein product [Nyctereutes procyonoides]